MQAQSFRPLLPSSLRSFPGGEFAKPGTCSTQAGQAPKLRAFGGKEYTPSPIFSTCHSEPSSPLDRKRQRPRSRGPAGDGVLRAPRRQPQSNFPPVQTTTPGGLCDNQHASRRRAQSRPPPLLQLRLLLGLQLQKEGRPVWTNRSPQPRDVRAGVCCLSEALKTSKWREAISCSRYHH